MPYLFEKAFIGIKVWCKAQKIGIRPKIAYEINPWWPKCRSKFTGTRLLHKDVL